MGKEHEITEMMAKEVTKAMFWKSRNPISPTGRERPESRPLVAWRRGAAGRGASRSGASRC